MSREVLMFSARKCYVFLIVMMMTVSMTFAPCSFAVPAYAEDGQEQAANISEIWVVPEVISGARQPASGGMFAWVTFDYYYTGAGLQNELDPKDFMLQTRLQGGEWTNVPGNNVTVLGGEDYYIASFEAIVAARVPDNEDPFIKKWRVVYKQGTDEEIASEVIVQAGNLNETTDVSVFDKNTCYDYTVEQVPWSYEQYQKDHIPPVYIAHVYPDAVVALKDPELAHTDKHKIVLPWMDWGEPWDIGDNGVSFSEDLLAMMETDLYLGTDSYSDEESESDSGIAAITGYWKSLESQGVWPGGAIPDGEDLYQKLSSTVCVPDEDADEYLSYVVEGSSVFWISGSGTEERLAQGVSDYILVVVRDWGAGGYVRHNWSEPSWEWTGNDDSGYTAAQATFTCANNDTHVRKVRAIIRCTSDDEENLTYTAIAAFNNKEYRASKTVKAPEEEPEQETKPSTKPAASLKAAPVTINTKTVNAAAVKKAVAAAAKKGKKPNEFIIGSKVKKISKNAFKGTNVKTLTIKSKKLTKKSVKGSLKGSKFKTVKVKAGSKKVNRKFIKKYKKIFTKKNAGRKVTVR